MLGPLVTLQGALRALLSPQDGILLGAVGAYDWNGAVLKETSSGRIIPHRESYLQEFPEELKNHGAYLGKEIAWRASISTATFMTWPGFFGKRCPGLAASRR